MRQAGQRRLFSGNLNPGKTELNPGKSFNSNFFDIIEFVYFLFFFTAFYNDL